MALKTVNITGKLYNPDGTPAANATGTAVLTKLEIDNGTVVPSVVSFTTDETGLLDINLWPNERGQAGSRYRLRAKTSKNGIVDTMITVPDSDAPVSLDDVIEAVPYPPVEYSKKILEQAQTAADEAMDAQADIHTNWQGKLDTAAQQAETATTQAGIATDKAAEASGSATTANAAKTAAELASELSKSYVYAALAGSRTYSNTTVGVAETVADQSFLIRTTNPQIYDVYLNDAGLPKFITKLSIADGSNYTNNNESDYFLEVSDQAGRVCMQITNSGIIEIGKANIHDFEAEKISVADAEIKTISSNSNSEAPILSIEDKEGRVAFEVDAEGKFWGTPGKLEKNDVTNINITNFKSGDWRESAVAFWDFKESAPPYKATYGREEFPLNDGPGSTVTSVSDGPFGTALEFNSKDFLIIPSSNVGRLNLSRVGDECTVVAWVKPVANTAFVAGMWQEDDKDPRRQYGMFGNLPTYGGRNQVCGHVSRFGGATPGYPYSRDYSSSARKITPQKWWMMAFTYDGNQAISYLDGIADNRPTYTDTLGNTYSKNPYIFDEGLNRDNVSDFTIGAVFLPSGWGHFFQGRMGGVAIFDRALSPEEIMSIHLDTLMPGSAFLNLDFYDTLEGLKTTNEHGLKSFSGSSGTDTSNTLLDSNFCINKFNNHNYLVRPPNENIGLVFIDTIVGIRLSQLTKINFQLNNSRAADVLRIVVNVGDKWFASVETFTVTGDGRNHDDWSNAEDKTFTVSRDSERWFNLEFLADNVLLLGSNIQSRIQNGTLNAVGFLNESCTGEIRIKDIKFYN